MTSYVPAELRRLVEERARNICEYCLIHVDDTFFGCQVDHIIAEKHGGLTVDDNLSLACTFCNRAKGSALRTDHSAYKCEAQASESGDLTTLIGTFQIAPSTRCIREDSVVSSVP